MSRHLINEAEQKNEGSFILYAGKNVDIHIYIDTVYIDMIDV